MQDLQRDLLLKLVNGIKSNADFDFALTLTKGEHLHLVLVSRYQILH